MSLSRRLRFEILTRDGHTCRYCGASAPDVKLEVDHVIPVALGGGDEPNNLVTACEDCNRGKASVQPGADVIEDVDSTAMLFAKALDRAVEIRNSEREVLNERVAMFKENWDGWTLVDHPEDGPAPLDHDWRNSVQRFLGLGLTIEELIGMVASSMNGKAYWDTKWKSFCKKAWTEVRERQELARRLIEDGEV